VVNNFEFITYYPLDKKSKMFYYQNQLRVEKLKEGGDRRGRRNDKKNGFWFEGF